MKLHPWKRNAVAAFLVVLAIGNISYRYALVPGDPAFPFDPYEELVYEAKFSRSLLPAITIAELRFTAARRSKSETIGPRRLDVRADVLTKGLFTRLFGLRFHERIDAVIDPATFTLLEDKKLDEQGKRRRSSETSFDQRSHELKWIERDLTDPSKPQRALNAKFEEHVQDLASAFYFLRLQPLEPGKTLSMTITDSGRVYRLQVTVSQKERMSTVLGNISVLRVDPRIFGDDRLIPNNGHLSIWLTDDKRHIPVHSRVTSDSGTLEVDLKHYSNRSVLKGKDA